MRVGQGNGRSSQHSRPAHSRLRASMLACGQDEQAEQQQCCGGDRRTAPPTASRVADLAVPPLGPLRSVLGHVHHVERDELVRPWQLLARVHPGAPPCRCVGAHWSCCAMRPLHGHRDEVVHGLPRDIEVCRFRRDADGVARRRCLPPGRRTRPASRHPCSALPTLNRTE